jgi:O-antigen/teichoic acid export membrane protein
MTDQTGRTQSADTILPAPTDVGVDTQQNETRAISRSPARTIMLGIGGRGTLMVVNMFVLVVTSRLLTPADFGIFAIAQLCVDFAAAASYALIGVPLLQRKRLRARDYWAPFTLLVILGVVAGSLLAVVAGALERSLGMRGLAALLRVTAIIVPARCTASFFIAALQRHLKVERIIWAQTKSQVTSALAVTLLCALLGFRAWSLLFGLAAATFLELTWCIHAFRIRPRFTSVAGWHRLVADGVAPFSNRMLTFAKDSIDRLTIGVVFGASPLGIYTRASNLVLIPTNLISLPAQNALISWFSRIKGQTDRVSNSLATAIAFQGLLLPPVAAGFWLATPPLVYLVLGPKWSAAIPLAQVLFVGAFARIGGVVAMESAALVSGHAWGTARRQLASFIMLVISLGIAVRFSLVWVSVAVVLAQMIYYALGLRFVAITFGMRWLPIIGAHVKGIFIACVGLAVSDAALAMTRTVPPHLRELLGLIAYAGTSGVLVVMGPDCLVAPVGTLSRSMMFDRWKRLRGSGVSV